MPGGVQGAAAQAGFDHDGAPGQRPDHPVPDEETAPGRRPAGRPLTDQDSLGRDSGQQVRVAGWIGHVHPAGQDRDGHAVRGQGTSVRAAVDAVRPTRYHRPAALGQCGGHLGADVGAVGRRGAGAHDGHRPQAAVPQVGLAAQPQRIWAPQAQHVQLRGPFRFARADQPDAVPVKSGQVHLGGYAAEPLAPGPEGVLQSCRIGPAAPAGPPGPPDRVPAPCRYCREAPRRDRRDKVGRSADLQQGSQHRIAGLSQVGEDGPRDAVLVKGGDHFTTPSHRPRA